MEVKIEPAFTLLYLAKEYSPAGGAPFATRTCNRNGPRLSNCVSYRKYETYFLNHELKCNVKCEQSVVNLG